MRNVMIVTRPHNISGMLTAVYMSSNNKEIEECLSNPGGTIIYSSPIDNYDCDIWDNDTLSWLIEPEIDYNMVSEIVFRGNAEEHLYPGSIYAMKHGAEFVKPTDEWLKLSGSKDDIFKLDNIKFYNKAGIVVLQYTSLYDRQINK